MKSYEEMNNPKTFFSELFGSVGRTLEARQKDYGNPEDFVRQVSHRWSRVLGVDVKPSEVARCMIEFKMARMSVGITKDTVDDVIGYAAILALILEGEGESEGK